MRKFTIDDVEYEVRSPNSQQRREARRVYNKTLAECLKDGCILRAQVEDFAIQKGMWSEEKKAEIKALRKEITQKSQKLEEGGIELSEGKKLAEEIRKLRGDLFELNIKLGEISTLTAETQAESEELNYLVSTCVYKGNKPYFSSLDDYYQKVETDPIAQVASLQFQYMYYGLDNDVTKNFVENKFLREFGFEKSEEEEDKPKERKPFLKNGKPVNAN